MSFTTNIGRALLVVLETLERHRRQANAKWVDGAHNRTLALVSETSRLPPGEDLDKDTQSRLFDKLLDIGRGTATAAPAFSRVVYEQALILRPNSRAARRGLARGAESLNEYEVALEHWKAFAAAAPDDTDVPEKIRVLERLKATSSELVDASKALPRTSAESGNNNIWRETLRATASSPDFLATVDANPRALQRLALSSQDRLVLDAAADFALARTIVDVVKPTQFTLDQFINAFDLRDMVQDKRLCLVANSAALLGQRLGHFIDAHDLVVRFNSFAILSDDTGTRTDIHVSIHLHEYNLAERVFLRIILGNSYSAWEKRVRSLDPSCQQHIGDSTLRYPLYSEKLCAEKMTSGAPTSGYNIIRLLHLFSNYSEVHLVGFDGYQSGALRLESAMHHQHAAIHDSSEEQAWIQANSERVGPICRRLTPLERMPRIAPEVTR